MHFGKEENHKTVIGGIGTILAALLFLGLALQQLMPIYNKDKPYLFSQEVPFEYEDADGKPVVMKLRDNKDAMYYFVLSDWNFETYKM